MSSLIVGITLPADTRKRVRKGLSLPASFPLLGPELAGRWQGLRFILGPWRWMLFVYEYLEHEDRVVVVTIQDAGSSSAARRER